MAHQTHEPQSLEAPPLSSDAPVIFDPPEHEDRIKRYPVTAAHVVALPPADCNAHRNHWLFILQVEGDQGYETVQLDLVEAAPGSRKCKVLCHKGLELDPDGHVTRIAKEAKMNVLPGHTVEKILGKMEASGLLYYEFVTIMGRRVGRRRWIDRVVDAFHKIEIFPSRSQDEVTWYNALSIRSALEEVWDNHMPMITSFPARLVSGTWFDPNQLSTPKQELAEVRQRIAASEELLHQRSLHLERLLSKGQLDLMDDEDPPS